jgi:hypothetical protein
MPSRSPSASRRISCYGESSRLASEDPACELCTRRCQRDDGSRSRKRSVAPWEPPHLCSVLRSSAPAALRETMGAVQGSVQLRRGSPRIYAGERGLQPTRKIAANKTSGFSRGPCDVVLDAPAFMLCSSQFCTGRYYRDDGSCSRKRSVAPWEPPHLCGGARASARAKDRGK